MKRSIIFLMALIILCAMPVFASTPEQDMVLIVDEGDGDFSGLQQVSDEEMSGVEGDMFCAISDPEKLGSVPSIALDRNAQKLDKDDVFKLFIGYIRAIIRITSWGWMDVVDAVLECIQEGKPVTYENIIDALLDF